jgi:hypothetical protein
MAAQRDTAKSCGVWQPTGGFRWQVSANLVAAGY